MPKPKNKKDDGSGELFKNSKFDAQVTKRYMKLRKLKRRPEFDFTVTVKDHKYTVHKEILKRCKFFDNLLQHNCKETSSNSVSMSFNEDIKIWSEIFDYLYTGKITITLENMFDIYTTSTYLMLDELKTFCYRFMKKSIKHETVEKIRDVAQQNFLTEIVEYATHFLEINFEDFTGHNEMVEWSFELVQELVKSDKLEVRSEAKVVELIANWLNHKFDSRKVHMDTLLNEVRYSFLTQDKITDAIDDDVYLSILQRFTNGMATYLDNPQRVYRPRLYYKGIYLLGVDYITGHCTFCRYFPNDKSLVTLNSTCQERYFAGSTILNDKVYLVGGLVCGAQPQFKETNKVEVYDPFGDAWSVGQPLNIARDGFGCCTFEGRIYVIGGFTVNQGEGLRSEVYSPDEDRWDFVPGDAPQESQMRMKAVAIGDSIFVVHQGDKVNGKCAYVIQQFKPGTNEWINIPHNACLETNPQRNKYLAVGHESKLFIIESQDSYIVYDTQTNTFNKFSFSPKLNREFFTEKTPLLVTTSRDLIYIFAGTPLKIEVGYDYHVVIFDPKEKLISSRHTDQNTISVQPPLQLLITGGCC